MVLDIGIMEVQGISMMISDEVFDKYMFFLHNHQVAYFGTSELLKEHGRRVDVIERDLTEFDRIVGELFQVFGYAIYRDGKNTKLSYPLEKFKSDISGRSFGNGRFIQQMREKATTLPKYDFFLSIHT
nr:squalene monooxygenase [Tanacetum cinerariifolium]